ncbi:MAG: hypothetical protein P2A85_00890 [Microcoleus anatoxicus]|uniref:hypothetical protein n=1 Tax=Microcoleus anatoxicus TaxID=2705319 RepID=UPI0036727E0E
MSVAQLFLFPKVRSPLLSESAIALIVRKYDRPYCPKVRSALSNFYSPHITKQLQVHIAELKFHLPSK